MGIKYGSLLKIKIWQPTFQNYSKVTFPYDSILLHKNHDSVIHEFRDFFLFSHIELVACFSLRSNAC